MKKFQKTVVATVVGFGLMCSAGVVDAKGKPTTNKGIAKSASVNKGQKGKEMSRNNKVAVKLPNGKVVYKNTNAIKPKTKSQQKKTK